MRFSVGVPDSVSADLADIIEQVAILTPALVEEALEARDAAEGFAAQAGAPYETRAAFIAGTVPAAVSLTAFFVNGQTYTVVRDATGPIVQTDGSRWRFDQVITFKDVPALLADTNFLQTDFTAGDTIRTNEEGFAYEVVSADQHVTTAGGVLLRIFAGDARLSVAAFGAVGDGVANDATAVQAAIAAAIAAGGGVVYFPAGEYLIEDASLTLTLTDDSPVALVGAGSYMTTLRFKGTFTDGIVFTSSTTSANQHPEFTVKGLSIRTSKLNAGTAVSAEWANGLNIERAFRMEDVVIGQYIKSLSDTGSDFGYWSAGVYIENARNSYFTDVYFYGEMDLSPNTGKAFELAGDSVFISFNNILVLEASTGIFATSTVEGIKVSNSSFVGTRNGIFFDGGAGAEPELCVVNCDFNTANEGVWTINIQGVSITNSFFFANSWLDAGGPWPEWRGVLMQGANSAYASIIGNNFTKENERTGDITTGIDCNGGGHYAIDGNRFYSIDPANLLSFGIQVRSGVTDVKVGNSNVFRNVSNLFANLGARSIRDKVTQSGTATVASGATINFPQAFTEGAHVMAIHNGSNTSLNCVVQSVTASGFVVNHNGGGSVVIDWIAVGN
jgi:hypothetical protein